jgi:hypothetical protein
MGGFLKKALKALSAREVPIFLAAEIREAQITCSICSTVSSILESVTPLLNTALFTSSLIVPLKITPGLFVLKSITLFSSLILPSFALQCFTMCLTITPKILSVNIFIRRRFPCTDVLDVAEMLKMLMGNVSVGKQQPIIKEELWGKNLQKYLDNLFTDVLKYAHVPSVDGRVL